MSRSTNTDLRGLFLYQVYVRNHTLEGTFQAFSKDLDRIKDLGTDIVYFLPIHEVGMKNKKGELGCPYSIKDYRSINHEYGTIEDFKNIIDEIHKRDMKVMIDVVYNHTSYDSVLINEHPEYFYKKDGNFANRVGDWWDITDLDYTVSKDLWVELIDTLVYWTKLGVDGFRFDVASLLPLEFLEEAHDRVLEVNKESIFLSESVHGGFLRYIRKEGFECLSESQVYEVFDMAYDYDSHPEFEGYLKGEKTLDSYIEALDRQEEIYPQNYIKMRNLENHDFGRFAPMVDNNPNKIDNWTAMVFFMKGSTMIYAGQEFCDNNKPNLFDKDDVVWDGRDISSLITTCSKIVKDPIFTKGYYEIIKTGKDVFEATYELDNEKVFGLFTLSDKNETVSIDLEDGVYTNMIDNSQITVKSKMVSLLNQPVILKVKK